MKKWSHKFQIYCGMKTVLGGMMFAQRLGCKKAVILKHAWYDYFIYVYVMY
jgi:hypothetical protein